MRNNHYIYISKKGNSATKLKIKKTMNATQITAEIKRAQKAIERAKQTIADNEALVKHYEAMLQPTQTTK